MDEEIVSAIKYQDTTACAHCHKSTKGLWHVEKIWAKGDIPKEAKLFFECPECKNIYCIECFNSFPNRHQCPQCGKKLQDEMQGMAIFMQEPSLKRRGIELNIQTDQQDDRIADVMCEMLFSYNCKRISAPATLYGVSAEKEFLELGEKGEVVVRVRNKAVKIGENWRLMSAGIC
jgi:ribosomal protein S27E